MKKTLLLIPVLAAGVVFANETEVTEPVAQEIQIESISKFEVTEKLLKAFIEKSGLSQEEAEEIVRVYEETVVKPKAETLKAKTIAADQIPAYAEKVAKKIEQIKEQIKSKTAE